MEGVLPARLGGTSGAAGSESIAGRGVSSFCESKSSRCQSCKVMVCFFSLTLKKGIASKLVKLLLAAGSTFKHLSSTLRANLEARGIDVPKSGGGMLGG